MLLLKKKKKRKIIWGPLILYFLSKKVLDLQKNKSLVSYIHFSMALKTYNICFFFLPPYKFVFLFLSPVTIFSFCVKKIGQFY